MIFKSLKSYLHSQLLMVEDPVINEIENSRLVRRVFDLLNILPRRTANIHLGWLRQMNILFTRIKPDEKNRVKSGKLYI